MKDVNLNDRVTLKGPEAVIVGIEHGFMGENITTIYEVISSMGKHYVSRDQFLTESDNAKGID